MRRMVYIPSDLATRIDEHLEFERRPHPSLTFSALARRALERWHDAEGRPSILELLGIESVEPDEVEPPETNGDDQASCLASGQTIERIVYMPEDLDDQVNEYLKSHPELDFSSLVCQALEVEVPAKDPSALLKLIGFVPRNAPRRHVANEERQPEDRVIDHER